jgi:ketosteroid isomerase-like protein
LTRPPDAVLAQDREPSRRLAMRLMEARFSGDITALRDVLHPEVTLRVIGDRVAIYPFPTMRDGIESVVGAIMDLHAAFDCVAWEIINMIFEDDRIAFVRKMDLSHRVTGRRGVVHSSNWLRVRDGRIVEIVQLSDNDALVWMLSA